MNEPHSDREIKAFHSRDRLHSQLPCYNKQLGGDESSLRFFFLNDSHAHTYSKGCRAHWRPVQRRVRARMHLACLLIASALTILCGIVLMRSICPSAYFLLLLQHLVSLAIKILVRNYWVSLKTRKDNFRLAAKVLEWTSESVHRYRLRIIGRLAWLTMKLVHLTLIEMMDGNLAGRNVLRAKLIRISHDTWRIVRFYLNSASSGSPTTPTSQILAGWDPVTCDSFSCHYMAQSNVCLIIKNAMVLA